MEWFESWFDSEYYHLLYEHRNVEEAEIFTANIAKLFPPIKYKKLLETACGKGRHALSFANKGYDVTGFDLSINSIAEAKKLQKENLALKFEVHNILDTFDQEEYDIVTNLFTSFGYFENTLLDLAAISNLKLALKKDGLIIQDYFNASLVKNDEIWQEKTVNNVHFKTKKTIENGYVYKEILVSDSKIGLNNISFEEKVRLITLEDFKQLYKANHLNIIDIYGDYELNKFDAAFSPRLIIIAQK